MFIRKINIWTFIYWVLFYHQNLTLSFFLHSTYYIYTLQCKYFVSECNFYSFKALHSWKLLRLQWFNFENLENPFGSTFTFFFSLFLIEDGFMVDWFLLGQFTMILQKREKEKKILFILKCQSGFCVYLLIHFLFKWKDQHFNRDSSFKSAYQNINVSQLLLM